MRVNPLIGGIKDENVDLEVNKEASHFFLLQKIPKRHTPH